MYKLQLLLRLVFFVSPCGYLLVIIGKTTLIIDKFTKFKLKSEET